MVLVQRCISVTEVAHGAAYSGLCGQVVLVQSCISVTEVAHGESHSQGYIEDSGLGGQIELLKS